MKTIDSAKLYEFFRDFRFALNGETGAENFMDRQAAAYAVYEKAVEYIDGRTKDEIDAIYKDPFRHILGVDTSGLSG